MPIATDAAFILPDDFAGAALMGRIWRPDLAGPSVVAIRQDGVFDVTDEFPTASQLAAAADPARALRASSGERVGTLQDLLNNTPPDTRDPTRPWLLAPIDLQVIKAAGVTFAVSMLERVIEERARGNPDSAVAIRAEVTRIVGTDLSRLKPGSAEAQHVKDVLVSQNAWSQYLEVGIGPDAEVFTKAPVLSAVGTCVDAGLHPKSTWNNPEPEVVLVVTRDGRIVGATLGNDVNLRDFEGRSALLLSKAKDNNASCAIGPFVRFFDESFTLDDVQEDGDLAGSEGAGRFCPAWRIFADPDQPRPGRHRRADDQREPSIPRRFRVVPRHHVRADPGPCREGAGVYPCGRRSGDGRHAEARPVDQPDAPQRRLRAVEVRPDRALRRVDAPQGRQPKQQLASSRDNRKALPQWRKSGSVWPAAASCPSCTCMPTGAFTAWMSKSGPLRRGAIMSSSLPVATRSRTAYRSFRDLIADADIDVIDICTPPNLHASMIVDAMQAGKHVICEKPFGGYFGREGDKAPIGKHVPKALMYERVLEEMENTRAAINKTGRLFMYAEDWIYAPAVTKTVEILKATKDKILFMKGEESHSGSHAAHAAQWAMTGGGSLIRMGCHPLSAVLYLKQVEAKARGEAISVASVTCDVGNVTACLRPDERAVLKANPVDVEDWGMLTATFSDGTKATVFSGDMILGGVRNLIETYTSSGALFANITPNTHMMSYQTSEEKLASVYITEKVDRKTGWQYVCIEEEWTRGYVQEIQDFMECVATGRQPLSDLALAFETIKVNYAGYWAAEEGRRVLL